MIVYNRCPSCGGQDFTNTLSVKDFSISGESFPVMTCQSCGLMFTDRVPEQDAIARYYRAEQYISHSDTTEGFINQLYHQVRRRTLRKKLQLIRKLTNAKKGSLLDIGSGTGSFLSIMLKAGWRVTGIEPDEIARKNSLSVHNIAALKPSESASLPSASFDVITMWHVLEHVHELGPQMIELKRLLKDDGTIFIAVPNHQSYDAQHYGAYWAAWDVPRHLYHFSPASMTHLAKQYGLEIITIKPMWFDSFYVSMLSEQYKRGKPGLVQALAIGLASNLKAMVDKRKCSSLIYVIRKSRPWQ